MAVGIDIDIESYRYGCFYKLGALSDLVPAAAPSDASQRHAHGIAKRTAHRHAGWPSLRPLGHGLRVALSPV